MTNHSTPLAVVAENNSTTRWNVFKQCFEMQRRLASGKGADGLPLTMEGDARFTQTSRSGKGAGRKSKAKAR